MHENKRGLYSKNHTTFRQGSSINAVGNFKEIVGPDTVSLGFASDADDMIHAPDERFRLSSLVRGQRAYVRMMLKLAREYGGGKHYFWCNATVKSAKRSGAPPPPPPPHVEL